MSESCLRLPCCSARHVQLSCFLHCETAPRSCHCHCGLTFDCTASTMFNTLCSPPHLMTTLPYTNQPLQPLEYDLAHSVSHFCGCFCDMLKRGSPSTHMENQNNCVTQGKQAKHDGRRQGAPTIASMVSEPQNELNTQFKTSEYATVCLRGEFGLLRFQQKHEDKDDPKGIQTDEDTQGSQVFNTNSKFCASE